MKRALHGSKRNKGLQLYLWGILFAPKGEDKRLAAMIYMNRDNALIRAKEMRMFMGGSARVVRLVAQMVKP